MADQVNPLGGLAPGLPPALLAAVKAQSAQERPRATKPDEAQPDQGLDGGRTDPSAESIDLAAKAYQSFIQQHSSNLSFLVDQSLGRFYFKLVDANTHEVIRQVPSDEVLAMARKLRGLTGSKGVLMDTEG